MKILLVDDDSEQRELICYCFKNACPGVQIVEAENGFQALEMLDNSVSSNELPDLMILDLNMPVMDGRNTLAQIKMKSILNNLLVALFTSSTAPIDRMFGRFNNTPLFIKSMELVECRKGVTNILKWYETARGTKATA